MIEMLQIAEIIEKYNLTDFLDTWDSKKLEQKGDLVNDTYLTFRNESKSECTLYISYRYMNVEYTNEDGTKYILSKLRVSLNWPTYGSIITDKVDELLSFYNTINNCAKDIERLDTEIRQICTKTKEDVIIEKNRENIKILWISLGIENDKIDKLKTTQSLVYSFNDIDDRVDDLIPGVYTMEKKVNSRYRKFEMKIANDMITITRI